MANSFFSKIKIRHILCFFAFIAGWPCVFYLMGWLPDYKINYLVLLALLFLFCFMNLALKVHRTISSLIIIQCLIWVFFSLIHSDTSYFTRITLLLIVYCVLAIQFKYQSTRAFIKIYDGWIAFQAICGTIGVILVLVNVLQPIFTFQEMDGRPGYFFGLFTTNTYYDGVVRNAGFYDEPGALACWGMMALLLNKVFIHDIKIERLLILGLISTFSMAFYIQILLYFLLFNRKKTFGVGYVVVSLCVVLLLMYFFASFNEEINYAIFGRFGFDKSAGHLEGDNRTGLAEITFAYFLQAPLFGHGASGLIELSQEAGNFVGANPFTLLAADGIVGYGVALLPFFTILLKSRSNKDIRYAWLIMLVGLLQRPYDGTQLLYPLIMYLFLQAELLYSKQKDQQLLTGRSVELPIAST